MDSYVLGKEDLLSEIERNKPDIVFIDMGLYARIDGIETSKIIRSLFKVPVMYVWIMVFSNLISQILNRLFDL